MRSVCLIFPILLCNAVVFAGEIREFDLRTLERLGNELSHCDEIAARAADLTLEGDPSWKKVTPQWWITDLGRNGDSVYLIDGRKPEPVLGYKVVFPKAGQPQVIDVRGQALPKNIRIRFKALQTAIAAVLPRLNRAYNPNYNFEVLDDPDGTGFLVYALAATTKANEQLLGGHVRTTVSADGSHVERIDDLSRGIIRQAPEPGKILAGFGTSQVIDTKYPVETFVYSSHLYRVPIGVATRDGKIWFVVNGKISDTGERAELPKQKSAKTSR